MDIQNSIEFLREFRKNTKSSKNRDYAEKFIRVINEVGLMPMDEFKRNRVNAELTLIHQNFEIQKEDINVKKELKKFMRFLKTEFSITLHWYYTSLGALTGLIVTVYFGFMPLAIGLLAGGFLGYLFDEKANREGKRLKTEMNEFIW